MYGAVRPNILRAPAASKREGARHRSAKRAPPDGSSRGDRARASGVEESPAADGGESSDGSDGDEPPNGHESSSGGEETAADGSRPQDAAGDRAGVVRELGRPGK